MVAIFLSLEVESGFYGLAVLGRDAAEEGFVVEDGFYDLARDLLFASSFRGWEVDADFADLGFDWAFFYITGYTVVISLLRDV